MESFDEIIDRARRVGGDYDNEHRLQMPDGSIKYLRVVAHGTPNQNGELGSVHEFLIKMKAETMQRAAKKVFASLS